MGSEKEEREVRHGLDAILKAARVTSGSATQVLETYGRELEPVDYISLYDMTRIPAMVAEAAEEEAWKSLAESNRKEVEILERLLEDQRKGRKTDRIWAVIGWGITMAISLVGWVIAVAVAVVGWAIAIISVLVQILT